MASDKDSSWKTILTEWINKTEWFNEYFDDIAQANIERFFADMKGRLGSVKAENVYDFIKENYHGFLCSNYFGDAGKNVDNGHRFLLATDDYIYGYTLLLHFACVKRHDQAMQSICNGMSKHQRAMIAFVFNGLQKLDYYPPLGIQCVIDEAQLEAENSNAKALPMVPTPRTKILDGYILQIRKLKGDLETLQVESAYQKTELESQLKDLEHKYEHSLKQVKCLQLDLQAAENKTPMIIEVNNDRKIDRLKKVLIEKDAQCVTVESEKHILEMGIQTLKKTNKELSINIRSLTQQNIQLENQLTSAHLTINNVKKINCQMSTDIKELQKIIEDLQSRNVSAPESSFECTFNMDKSIVMPENLADIMGHGHQVDSELLNQTQAVISEFQLIRKEYSVLLSQSNVGKTTTKHMTLGEIPQEIRNITEQFRKKFDELIVERKQLEESLERFTSENNKVKLEKLSFTNRIADLQKENVKLDAILGESQRAIKNVIKSRDRDLAAMSAKLNEAKKTHTTITAENVAICAKFEKENEQLKLHIQKLQQRLDNVENIPCDNLPAYVNPPAVKTPVKKPSWSANGFVDASRQHLFHSIAYEELERRNSICPPHLRSAYAAQYSEYQWNRNATYKKVDPEDS